jgi:hypothetical protein
MAWHGMETGAEMNADPQPPVASKADLLQRLTALAPAIRGLGVRRLGLFGSFRHDRPTPDSDVDLYVEFTPGEYVHLHTAQPHRGDGWSVGRGSALPGCPLTDSCTPSVWMSMAESGRGLRCSEACRTGSSLRWRRTDAGAAYPLNKFLGNFAGHIKARRIETAPGGHRLTQLGKAYFADRTIPAALSASIGPRSRPWHAASAPAGLRGGYRWI